VFPAALAIVVAAQTAILTLHNFRFWSAFATWFVRLPLT